MTDINLLRSAMGRLIDGEPVRTLIGHSLHEACEIVPTPAFAARLRADMARDIAETIAGLRPDDPAPASPATAMPAPEEKAV